jgi:hypothetical protein
VPVAPMKGSRPLPVPLARSLNNEFTEVALESQEANVAAATLPSGAYGITHGPIGTNIEEAAKEEEAAKKLGGRRRKTKHRKHHKSKRHTRKHRKTRRRVHFDRI